MTGLEVLRAHEILKLEFNPIPGSLLPRTGGYWVAIAVCKCGHTSPPEHRANHLAAELVNAL